MSEPYRYKMYRWLIFGRIKAALGLDRCAIFLSAAAPIATETKKYFMSIDIPVTDVSVVEYTSVTVLRFCYSRTLITDLKNREFIPHEISPLISAYLENSAQSTLPASRC